jgi:FOG: TPR repeat
MAAATPGQSDWVTPPSSSSSSSPSSSSSSPGDGGASGGMDMDGLMAAVGGLAQSSGAQPSMGGSGQPSMIGSSQPATAGSTTPNKPAQATGATKPGVQPAAPKTTATPEPNTVPPSADLAATLNNLNNQAVIAINDSNYEFAVRKLEEALKIDPSYASAKSNLAIAYNNYALQLQGQSRTEEALKILHRAYAIDPTNEKTKTNLEAIIQIMGKSPTSFKDRVDLANRCVTIGDAIGAKIEYEAALAIKRDPMVVERLQALASGRMPPAGGAPTAQASKSPAANKPPPKRPAGQPQVPQQPPQGESDDTGGGGETTAQQPASVTGKPAGGAVSQKLNTLYKGLSNLEKKTFSRTFETDDILTRLSRVETKLLGKTQTGDPIRRLDTLLLLQ